MKKLTIRSLENMNTIHEPDYFDPIPYNAWGFQMDTCSMTIAFVTKSNTAQILEIEPDLNRMQYGADYAKKVWIPWWITKGKRKQMLSLVAIS